MNFGESTRTQIATPKTIHPAIYVKISEHIYQALQKVNDLTYKQDKVDKEEKILQNVCKKTLHCEEPLLKYF